MYHIIRKKAGEPNEKQIGEIQTKLDATCRERDENRRGGYLCVGSAGVISSPIQELKRKLFQNQILLAALLGLATLLLFAPAARFDFLNYDDLKYVTRNPHVNTGLNVPNVLWAFSNLYEANWDPITWISHMLDCQLFGLHAGWHHMVNVAIHVANSILLFVILQKATDATQRSLFVAALFAVHPLNVENVAWIAERKSLLSAFFSLLTVAAYGWYLQNPDWKRYLGVACAFAMALMAKPMAVSLPVVLLVLDFWPMHRYEQLPFFSRLASCLKDKWPLLVLGAADSAVTVIAQRTGGALAGLAQLSISARFQNASVACATYIYKLFWPSKLAVLHPMHPYSQSKVGFAVLALVAISLLVLRFRRIHYLVAGSLIFLITLIPVVGIVQIGSNAMADRFAYIPYIGLYIIAAWGLRDLARLTRLPQYLVPLLALSAILALSSVTARYLQNWRNGVTLFTEASRVSDQPNDIIEEGLGDALLFAGQPDVAYGHYARACALNPTLALCHVNMADILYEHHQLWDALGQYEIGARLSGDKVLVVYCLTNSGKILITLGNYRSAYDVLNSALKLDPANPEAKTQLQNLYRQP